MNLIELAQEKGLKPKRTSSHGGGEYHCACPRCNDGDDRFAIWPNEPSRKCIGRYWCRICDAKGDAIQFCRDFLNLSYPEACNKLNLALAESTTRFMLEKEKVSLKIPTEPTLAWQKRARICIEWFHQQLLRNPEALKKLYERGFNDVSIRRFKLGYCPKDIWRPYSEWGLDAEIKANGKQRMIWFPRGLVVPWIHSSDKVLKINIRRLGWHPNDKFGKYIKIPGSMNCPATYGDDSLTTAIILESEFDALLIQQEAGDIVFCIANGGSSQPLDLHTNHLIQKTSLVLFCPDVDMGGVKFLNRLEANCRNGELWPAPLGKSPGDAFQLGIDLRQWISDGVNQRAG